MKIAIALSDEVLNSLERLYQEQMPLATALKVATARRKIHEARVKYENFRLEALKELGEKDDKGELKSDEKGAAVLSEDARTVFFDKIQKLANEEVEIAMITMQELGDKVNLAPHDVDRLGFLLKA